MYCTILLKQLIGVILMIRSNLSILLAEQNLKITKVSNDTGISRTTLTALASNYGQGIQFDTINKLCMYLRVDPGELISYVPVDIEIISLYIDEPFLKKDVSYVNLVPNLELKITDRNRSFYVDIIADIDIHFSDTEVCSINVDIELQDPEWQSDIEMKKIIKDENQIIINAFGQISRPFFTDLESIILEEILSEIEDRLKFVNDEGIIEEIVIPEDLNLSFNWSSELTKHLKGSGITK